MHQLTIKPADFDRFTAKSTLASTEEDGKLLRLLELRVTFAPETLRYVVQAEGQEHFFDNLEQAITQYNLY